jgi:hypothetical protein
MQLVLGESCRYALAALWAAMLTCATASAQTPHVRLESGSVHGSKIEAIHDDKKIPLQFRSIVVQTDFPGEKSGECAVQMIYDPESKFFEWHSFQTYQGYDAELEAKQFANNSIVYLAPDGLVVFSRLMFLSQVAVWESREHYDSMDRGQDSVMRLFEEHRVPADAPWSARFKTVDLMKEIPRSFMEQCYDWDWSGADKEIRRAIELNPSYADAHRLHAEVLWQTGRLNEAIAESKETWNLIQSRSVITSIWVWNTSWHGSMTK